MELHIKWSPESIILGTKRCTTKIREQTILLLDVCRTFSFLVVEASPSGKELSICFGWNTPLFCTPLSLIVLFNVVVTGLIDSCETLVCLSTHGRSQVCRSTCILVGRINFCLCGVASHGPYRACKYSSFISEDSI